MFYTYILRCADQSFHVGHTDDIESSLAQHQSGQGAGRATRMRRPVQLVFSRAFDSREAAMAYQARIRRWSRARKESLIAAAAPKRDVSPDGRMSPIHVQWMRRALALADRGEREDDEVPVGAVLVGPDGALLAEGWNRNITEHDPSAHAEIVAMRQAGMRLGNHRLTGCTLYVTLEPCAMCAMAMVHARIARVVFGASDPKTGACGSVFGLLGDSRHNHRVEAIGGVLADEASRRLVAYFRARRDRSGRQ